jgi:hypothetical protein
MEIDERKWKEIVEWMKSEYPLEYLVKIVDEGIDGTSMVFRFPDGRIETRRRKGMIEEYLYRYCVENGIPIYSGTIRIR